MKFSDIVGLAFSSLWQQRGRTVLSLVGVVVGSLILIFSLAAQGGVQEAVVRVFSESEEMRMVEIWPQYFTPETEIPAAEVEPAGEMSDEKRKRIRKMLVAKWQEDHQRERRGITRERLAELKATEHVAQVVPELLTTGWAVFGELKVNGMIGGVPANDKVLPERLVAGKLLAGDSDNGVLVHEYLAYQWGAKSDEALRKLINKRMQVELRFPAEEVVSEEFVIRGIFRAANLEEEEGGFRSGRYHPYAIVLLPIETATSLFFDRLDNVGVGFMHATLLVDDEQHLRQVSQRMRDLGYNERSLLRLVERIKRYVVNITWVFAAVAGVALFVAAVGIANTMILSVVERTHEIGVMKATGARDGHVLLIFLFEGALIGLLGAIAAIAISWGMAFGIDYAIREIIESELRRSFENESTLVFSWWVYALVLGFSTLVTVLAAVFPARRAARISPVTALRHE